MVVARVRVPATPRGAAAALGVAVLLLGLVVAVGWLGSGGRWLRVETPSMGTVAPVGSLLWVRPAELADVSVGDLVTVRPASTDGRTFSHEVASIGAGGLRTRGVLSGDDPWVIDQSQLVGRVVDVWPVVGVLVLVAPLLLALLGLTFLVAARVPFTWRLPVQMLGVSAALSTVLVVHHPLTDARMLAFDATRGEATSTWVNAGQVPLRLRAPETGAAATMGPGETATVEVTRTDAQGRYVVDVRPDLPWWTWWLVGGVWIVPALGSTLAPHLRERRTPRPA